MESDLMYKEDNIKFENSKDRVTYSKNLFETSITAASEQKSDSVIVNEVNSGHLLLHIPREKNRSINSTCKQYSYKLEHENTYPHSSSYVEHRSLKNTPQSTNSDEFLNSMVLNLPKYDPKFC